MIANIDELENIEKTELGGKAYSLCVLTTNGVAVPRGIVVSALHFIDCLKENNVFDWIVDCAKEVDFENAASSSEKLQSAVLGCNLNADVISEIKSKIQELDDYVSVRSSAASEDGEQHTFAGLQDTYLNVSCNIDDIVAAIKKCWASLFNERALLYRVRKKIPIFEGIAVVIQNMVQAECAGVVYTRHPIDDKYILVESAFGIGDIVVDGTVKPDSFLIERDTLNIANRELGRKSKKTENKDGIHTVSEIENADVFSINDDVIKELISCSLEIEKIFGRTQDIEWAYDGKLWFLQSRAVNF